MKFLEGSGIEVMKSEGFSASEYEFGDKDINLARIELKGRYPETGFALNTESKMACLVLSGSGSITVEATHFELKAGDACVVEQNEQYFWEADVVLLIASTPAWRKSQSKNVT